MEISPKHTKRIADLRSMGANRQADAYEAQLRPTGAGVERAMERELERAIQEREVYADTPPAPITRQQMRAASRASTKAARQNARQEARMAKRRANLEKKFGPITA